MLMWVEAASPPSSPSSISSTPTDVDHRSQLVAGSASGMDHHQSLC